MVLSHELVIQTAGRGFIELTAEIDRWVRVSGIDCGLCAAHIQHASASLVISENADRQVLRDLERYLQRLVPDGDALFQHVDEGEDDMPAHVRSVLTHTDLTVPVRHGALALGVWQGIFLWEHRLRSQRRTILLTAMGEP